MTARRTAALLAGVSLISLIAGFTAGPALAQTNTATGVNAGINVTGSGNQASGQNAGQFVTGLDNQASGHNSGITTVLSSHSIWEQTLPAIPPIPAIAGCALGSPQGGRRERSRIIGGEVARLRDIGAPGHE